MTSSSSDSRAAQLFFVAIAFFMACGGRAALEGFDPEANQVPSSGAGATASSSQTVTATVDGPGPGPGPGPMTTIGVVSSSSGMGSCDNTGTCEFCAQCAFNGPCADEWAACFMDPDCAAFAQCMQDCGGPGMGCFPECAAQFPGGVQQWIGALQCVLCDECQNDCQNQAPPQLCNF